MTVFENLLVGATFGGALAEHGGLRRVHRRARSAPVSKRRANQLAGTLTLLDRKRLELARALATRPKLLLLDEIAGGLTEPETHELVDEISRVKEQGVTIVWIEHVVHALLAVADRLLVIISASVSPKDCRPR